MSQAHQFASASLVRAGNGAAMELIIPVAGILLLVCVVFAILFLMLRSRIQRVAAQVRSRDKAATNLASELEAQALLVRQMSMDLEELRRQLAHHQEPVQPSVPLWASPDLPVNLNRRGQILRLSRKGKSVAEIAHDLNVAQGEVELLLKVHDLSSGMSESENSEKK